MSKSSPRSFIVCAFYTTKTPYAREARKLIKSCNNHNIPHYIVPIDQQEDWTANCAQKPKIILQALAKNPDKNIVYLDADARVMRYPDLFDSLDCDIGVHYLHGQELLSGTIFLANNSKVHNLVALWGNIQAEARHVWDQQVLQDTLRAFGASLGIKLVNIPATYCQIHDTMAGAGRPVIKHMQASRSLKKVVSQ